MKCAPYKSSLYPAPSSFVKGRQSLVQVWPEMGRVLADRDKITFRASGTCMYPTVRPGDILTIRSCPPSDARIGDIAVCSGPDYLFSHRVVDKGALNGNAFVLTRPDRSRYGNDGPTYDENMIGVVVAIKRNGKDVPLEPTEYSLPLRVYYQMCLMMITHAERLRLLAQTVLPRLLNTSLYRVVGKTFWSIARPRLVFKLQLPVNSTLWPAVHRSLNPEEFDPRMQWKGRPIDRWSLSLLVTGAQEPAAWITFERPGSGGWRIEESHVRLRFSGLGLEDTLLERAREILAREI